MISMAGFEDPELKKLKEQERLAAQAKAKAEPGLLQTAVEKPKTPFENLRDEHGTGGAILRMIGTGLSGGLLGDVLTPETGAAAQAEYESNLDLYNKYREMALIDPQVQAYADLQNDPNATPQQLASAAILAGGVSEYDPNATVLKPGDLMVSGTGSTLAAGGPSVQDPTSVMQNAQEIAAGYGIPPGSRAYSDLMSALAEPSGTETLADGSTRTFNTVNKVVADWQNGVYGPATQQGQAGGQAGAAAPASDGSISPEDAALAKGRAARNVHDADNYAISDDKIAFYDDLERVLGNFGTWDPDANDGEGAFTLNDATADNYGSWDNHPLNPGAYKPFKGQGEKDALVYMDQLIDMLTVDERGKLKGQGQITEGETAMLVRATTAARNRDLGDKAVQRELGVLMRQLMKRRQKFMDLQRRYAPERFEGQGNGPVVIDLD